MERNNVIITRLGLLDFILCLQQVEEIRAKSTTDNERPQSGDENSKPHSVGG